MTTAYLIETCDPLDPGAAGVLAALEAGELAAFLALNIEHEHYSGDGYAVTRLFRYADGALTPLAVHQTGRTADSDDYLHWTYEVRPDGRTAPDVTFTVRIDGRA